MSRTLDPIRHDQRRRAIVEAAVGLFAEHGYAGTTTAEIARAAGVSTGALFHYFRSKREVFCAMFGLDTEQWDDAFAAAEADPDPWAALLRVVDRIAAEAADPMVAGLTAEIMATAHRDPEVAALMADNDRRVLTGVSRLVERLETAGAIRSGMSAEHAARWLVTLTDGLYPRGYDEPGFDRVQATRQVKELIARVLCHDEQRSGAD